MNKVITSARAGKNGGVTVWSVVKAFIRSAVTNIVSPELNWDWLSGRPASRRTGGCRSTAPSPVTRLFCCDRGAEVGGLRVDDDGLVRRPARSRTARGQLGERDLLRPADVDDAVERGGCATRGDLGGDVGDGDRLDQRVGGVHLVTDDQRTGDASRRTRGTAWPARSCTAGRTSMIVALLHDFGPHVAALGQVVGARRWTTRRSARRRRPWRPPRSGSRVDLVKKSITGSSSKDGELVRSTRTSAPASASARPAPVSTSAPVERRRGDHVVARVRRSSSTTFEPDLPGGADDRDLCHHGEHLSRSVTPPASRSRPRDRTLESP